MPFAFAIGSLITRAAGRRLDPHHAPLDAGHLAVPERRHRARAGLGVRGARLGRLLGLGPGGERLPAALAHRHGLPALGDDAGEEGHDEGLEHGAGFGHLLPLHLRDVPDALAASSARCTPSRSRPSASTSSASWRWRIAATIYLILDRLDYLKSEAQLESVISRESSFLFNNLILLASCFAVLWGTLFPVISEAVTGEKISVGTPFFNRLKIPIGLFLLFLTGVGPLFAWRRTSVESLRRNFLWPAHRWAGRWWGCWLAAACATSTR